VFPYLSHLAGMNRSPADVRRITIISLQALLWAVFYLLLLLYTSHKWSHPLFGFLNATIATVSYAVAIYVHAFWLLPRVLYRGRKGAYFLYSFLFLAALIVLRMFVESEVLFPLHKTFYAWQWAHFSFDCITILVAFLFGALLRVAINYVHLLEVKKELQRGQAEAELNLLKAQVQPHFLFNTLNNIYSLAQSRSEKTPEMIVRLSGLMRYFIDDAPKEKIPLSVEMDFIRNYIELEQIRMVYPVKVEMDLADGVEERKIPPMLLVPFVENAFKHGVDKLSSNTRLLIKLREQNGRLEYEVVNSMCGEKDNCLSKGFGLQNLRKRLDLLYPGEYRLNTSERDANFIAGLSIPLS
jgi:uncharacterized integral membrane protein